MATLNHTNLTSYNVPALKEFFCRVFDFQLLDERGDKLAVLRNSDGFLLTLMYDKRMTPEQGYPGMFHVGFLQPTPDERTWYRFAVPPPLISGGCATVARFLRCCATMRRAA